MPADALSIIPKLLCNLNTRHYIIKMSVISDMSCSYCVFTYQSIKFQIYQHFNFQKYDEGDT